MCCSRWINAAQGIRTRTREVTAPPLMGGAVVQGGVSCLLDFRSANFGDLWGMGARKKPKTPDEVCFWRVKANVFGAMAYSRRSGSLPGGSVDDPGDPPIAEGIGCSADIQQVLCGRGRGRASVMEIQILVTARAQHGRTLQKNGCFFFLKSCLEDFFKTIRDQSVNIYWTVQTHWSTIPTGFAGGGLPRSTALRSRRLRRDLPGTIWDAGRVSEKTIQWFGAERFGAMVGPTWPNKTQPGSQLELPIEFPNHKIVYRNMQKQLWYG